MTQGTRAWASAVGDRIELWPWLLESLAEAEMAVVLVSGGTALAMVWLASPRAIAAAVAGLLLLSGGIVGLSVLSVHAAAVVLLVLAVASLAMEVLAAPGLPLHAVGGGVALAMAGLCLKEPWTGAHPGVVVPTSASVAALTWMAGRRSWRAVRDDPFASSSTLVGRSAVVLTVSTDDPWFGHAVVAGKVCRIRCAARLTAGCSIRVESQSATVLTVELLPPDSGAPLRQLGERP
jgi:membrane-bound ClpP family serine protease